MIDDVKIILFDLGKVLMHIDFEAFPNGLGLTTKEQRLQFDQRKIQNAVRTYETGLISTDEFLDSLHEIFQRKFSRERILEAFDRIIIADNHEIIPFVEDVGQRYRIAVLSNTCASHWEKALHISSILKKIPNLFTSFHLGAMKPDTIVYKKVCGILNVQPPDVLFIDDLQENVEGANIVGLKGIIFRDILQLQRDFQNRQWHTALKVKY